MIMQYFGREGKHISQKPSSPDTNKTTKTFNVKYDYSNAMSVSKTSTHPNLLIDNQHEKPTLEDV